MQKNIRSSLSKRILAVVLTIATLASFAPMTVSAVGETFSVTFTDGTTPRESAITMTGANWGEGTRGEVDGRSSFTATSETDKPRATYCENTTTTETEEPDYVTVKLYIADASNHDSSYFELNGGGAQYKWNTSSYAWVDGWNTVKLNISDCTVSTLEIANLASIRFYSYGQVGSTHTVSVGEIKLGYSNALAGTAPTQEPVEAGTVITLPENTFVNDGYEFAGWTDGTATYQAGAEYTVNANTVFTATWTEETTETYTVTFTDGTAEKESALTFGGNWGSASRVDVDGAAGFTATNASGRPCAILCIIATTTETATPDYITSKLYVEDASNIDAATLELNNSANNARYAWDITGYEWVDGWNTVTVKLSDAKESTLGAISNVGSIRFYSYGKSGTHTVACSEIKLGYLKQLPLQEPVTAGTVITLPTPEFTNAGYTFAGWNDGVATYQAGAEYTVNADTAFAPVWEKITYTVEFAGGEGAEGTAPESITALTGDVIVLPVNPFTKEGYRFDGWSDGENTYTVGYSYTVNASVTFTAQWSVASGEGYTVIFTDGLSQRLSAAPLSGPWGANNPTTVDGLIAYNSTASADNRKTTAIYCALASTEETTNPDLVIAELYVSDADCIESAYFELNNAANNARYSWIITDHDWVDGWNTVTMNLSDMNERTLGGIANLAAIRFYCHTTAGASLTVCAKTVNLGYGIKLDGTAPESVTAEAGSAIVLPENGFVNPGFVFAGWTDGVATYQAGDSYTVNADTTFTPVWNVKTYTVTFENGAPSTESAITMTGANWGEGTRGTVDGRASFTQTSETGKPRATYCENTTTTETEEPDYVTAKLYIADASNHLESYFELNGSGGVQYRWNTSSYAWVDGWNTVTLNIFDCAVSTLEIANLASIRFYSYGQVGSTHTVSVGEIKLGYYADITGEAPTQAPVEENASITLPANTFVYEGYKFEGWTDGFKTYEENDTYKVTEDVTFTAKWSLIPTADCEVTFTGGTSERESAITMTGANWGEGTRGTVDGRASFTQTSETGKPRATYCENTTTTETEEPVAVKAMLYIADASNHLESYFELNGPSAQYRWNTSSYAWVDGWNTVTLNISDCAVSTLEIANLASIRFYSYGQVGSTHTVSVGNIYLVYNVEITENAPVQEAVVSGTKIILPENTFTNEGYVFAGWTDGENTYPAGYEYTVNSTVKFTATWLPEGTNVIEVTFAPGGVSRETPLEFAANWGEGTRGTIDGVASFTQTSATGRPRATLCSYVSIAEIDNPELIKARLYVSSAAEFNEGYFELNGSGGIQYRWNLTNYEWVDGWNDVELDIADCAVSTLGSIANLTSIRFYAYGNVGTTYTVAVGPINFAYNTVAQGSAPAQAPVAEGTVITLPENTYAIYGYRFAGWNDGTATYQAGAEYTVTEAVTFTATWEKGEAISATSNELYKTTIPFTSLPSTFEAVVNFPADTMPAMRGGVIAGNNDERYFAAFNLEIAAGGSPRLFMRKVDGTTVDCVFDQVNVYTGKDVHIAIVKDSANGIVSCYIDGVLAQKVKLDTPENIIMCNLLVLGGDLRVDNTQYFKGTIKSVALYSDVRDANKIAADAAAASIPTDNLMAGYVVTDAEVIEDVSGNGYDLAFNEIWFDENTVDEYDYSFAVVGDIQTISRATPEKLHILFDWLLANKDEKKINHTFILGDLTDFDTLAEWELSTTQVKRLDGVMNYSVTRGNHDYVGKFNKYFTYDEYKDTIGGAYKNLMLNTFKTFEAGGNKYLSLVLDWSITDGGIEWANKVVEAHPDHNVIVTTHSFLYLDGSIHGPHNSEKLPTTSYPTRSDMHGYNDAIDLWNKLIKKHDNIVLVLGGHTDAESIMVTELTGDNGNKIKAMLIDPQYTDSVYGGVGMVAMLYFSNGGRDIEVEYYSTMKEQYYYTSNQFKMNLEVVDNETPKTYVSGTVEMPYAEGEFTVALMQGETAAYTETFTATAAEKQGFKFDSVAAGTYDLVVSADGYVNSTVKSVVVNGSVDLSENTIRLALGDMNGDKYIDAAEVTMFAADMNKSASEAAYPETDLNGDGYRDANDVAILAFNLLKPAYKEDYVYVEPAKYVKPTVEGEQTITLNNCDEKGASWGSEGFGVATENAPEGTGYYSATHSDLAVVCAKTGEQTVDISAFEDGYITLKLYISDVTKVKKYIGFDMWDKDGNGTEWEFLLKVEDGLVNGWNDIKLSFHDAEYIAADLAAINHIRIYCYATGGELTLGVDDIKISAAE